MIPKDSKILAVEDSIIDELFETFMQDNMPPEIMVNMKPEYTYIFKGIFMAGAQAFSAITDAMENAKIPQHVGERQYEVMIDSAEKQMLGKPFLLGMEAMKMPTPSEVH